MEENLSSIIVYIFNYFLLFKFRMKKIKKLFHLRKKINPLLASMITSAEKKLKGSLATAAERSSDNELNKTFIELEECLKNTNGVPLFNKEKELYENPLLWWQANECRSPFIATLAKKYLHLQASEAPSERVFRVLTFLVNNYRNKMNPVLQKSLKMIAFLNTNKPFLLNCKK